jgi:hypothetical protein
MRFKEVEASSISKVKSGQALPDDVMVLEDGRWKIHHKSVQIDFKKA